MLMTDKLQLHRTWSLTECIIYSQLLYSAAVDYLIVPCLNQLCQHTKTAYYAQAMLAYCAYPY